MPRYPWRFGAESGFSPRVCHWASAIGDGGEWHAAVCTHKKRPAEGLRRGADFVVGLV